MTGLLQKFLITGFMLIFIAGVSISTTYAQERTRITGTVTDAADGFALAGVNVQILDTDIGTITNVEGWYEIFATPEDVLVFSYVGMIRQQVRVGNQTIIDVELVQDVIMGQELVVTAFGLERETKALGYSISVVRSEDIAQTGETNPISSLAGKVAGLDITETTAGPSGSRRVVIRGINQILGDNQPLYVIDGVPVENSSLGQASQWGGFDLGDGTLDLNPDDIESISVLKGASAAALYGSRALNGVILVTTKTGSRQSGIGIEVNSSNTIDRISTRLDNVQKIYGQGSNGTFPEEGQITRNITSAWGPRLGSDNLILQADGTQRPYTRISNNVSDFFRLGITRHNTVTLSTGTEASTLRFSYSNVNNSDIIPQSGLNRNMFTLRGTTRATDFLSFDSRISYSSEEVKNRPALADEVNNIGNGLVGLVPNFDQEWLKAYKDENGNYIDYTGNPFRANPYWTLNETLNESQRDRITGFLSANVEIAEPLLLRLRAGVDQYSYLFTNFFNFGTPTRDGGQLVERNFNVMETNFEAFLMYATRLSRDIDLTATAGTSRMNNNLKISDILGTEIIAPGLVSLTNFQNLAVTPQEYRKEIQSVIGFAQMGFRDYLYLEMTARNDWSSTLPTENNSFFYPSVSVSFIPTDAFDLGIPALSFAKLRASWAQVGGDTDPYMLNLTYSMSGRSHMGMPLGGITGSVMPNPNLKPETSESYELGTDIRMFEGRATLDFAFFNTMTKDQILQVQIPEASGFERAIINSGDMKNRGIEFMVTGVPVVNNNLRWEISANYTKIWNTVERLSDQVDAITIADARWSGVSIIAQEGKEFGIIMGRAFQRDDQGRIIHGADGLPLSTDEPVALGNILPDFSAGIMNTVSYRNFSVKAAIDFRIGGDIYSITNRQLYLSGMHGETKGSRDGFNFWAQTNQAAQQAWVDAGNDPNAFVGIPYDDNFRNQYQDQYEFFVGKGVKQVGVDSNGNPIYEINDVLVNPATYWNRAANDIPELNVYDASFIKLRDVSIGYTIPRRLLANLPVTSATFSVVGRNLYTFHKNVPNIDPESTYNNSNGQGLEYGSLPTRRHFGFNLNFKF